MKGISLIDQPAKHTHGFFVRLAPETSPGRPPPPVVSELKWVQGHGFRCLAFWDKNNRWVNFYTGRVLDRAVKLLYLNGAEADGRDHGG